MNIFFTGAVRGGRAHQPEYATIVRALERHGTVSSSHVSDDSLSHYGETNVSADEILERELKAVEKSDIVVAEVTTPSLGVGYLLARATALGKKVIALYRGENTLELSAIIKGDPRIKVQAYTDTQNLENILSECL